MPKNRKPTEKQLKEYDISRADHKIDIKFMVDGRYYHIRDKIMRKNVLVGYAKGKYYLIRNNIDRQVFTKRFRQNKPKFGLITKLI